MEIDMIVMKGSELDRMLQPPRNDSNLDLYLKATGQTKDMLVSTGESHDDRLSPLGDLLRYSPIYGVEILEPRGDRERLERQLRYWKLFAEPYERTFNALKDALLTGRRFDAWPIHRFGRPSGKPVDDLKFLRTGYLLGQRMISRIEKQLEWEPKNIREQARRDEEAKHRDAQAAAWSAAGLEARTITLDPEPKAR
jgi:hypothetical protein